MKTKPVLCPERLRHVPCQFSWIDHRLVRERNIRGRSPEALALYELLRCRVRHFSAGLALGPLAFVRQLVKGLSPASKDTARRCGLCKAVDIYTARWLRGGDKVSLPRRRQA